VAQTGACEPNEPPARSDPNATHGEPKINRDEDRMHWEYCFIPVPPEREEKELLEALNKQGRQGWEMVTAIERSGTTLIVFKRRPPKESDQKKKGEN